MALRIRRAGPGDSGLVLALIRELADYEKLAHEVVATEAMIEAALFAVDTTTRRRDMMRSQGNVKSTAKTLRRANNN